MPPQPPPTPGHATVTRARAGPRAAAAANPPRSRSRPRHRRKKSAPAPLPKVEKPSRAKPWFVDLFDEDYLRTLPFFTPQATQAEAEFVADAMGLAPGAQVLDVGCGYAVTRWSSRRAATHVVGSICPRRCWCAVARRAHRRGLTINFIRGDMRELDFDAQFDGAYCLFSDVRLLRRRDEQEGRREHRARAQSPAARC